MILDTKLTVRFFARADSQDAWPRSWHVVAFHSLDASRIAAELAIETSFPTAGGFEVIDANGNILYAWPLDLELPRLAHG